MISPFEQITRDLEAVTEEAIAAVIQHTGPVTPDPDSKPLGTIADLNTRRLFALAGHYRNEGLRIALQYELANVGRPTREALPTEVSRWKALADLCRDLAWFCVKDELSAWPYDGQLKLYPGWAIHHEPEKESPVETVLTQLFSAMAKSRAGDEDEEEQSPSVQ